MANIPFEFAAWPTSFWGSRWMAELSPRSLLLYIFLLDRKRLSIKRGLAQTDENGEVFIHCTREEAMYALRVSRYEVTSIFKQLEGAGFIRREHQAGPYPDHIYVYPPEGGKDSAPEGQDNSPYRGRKAAPEGQENSPSRGRKVAPEGQVNSPCRGKKAAHTPYKQSKQSFSRDEEESISLPTAILEKDVTDFFESMLPETQDLYREWSAYTKESGKHTGSRSQLRIMEDMEAYTLAYGAAAVRALVDEAIENGWRNLYFEKLDNDPHKYDPLRFAPE